MKKKIYYFYAADIESREIFYLGNSKTIKSGLAKMFQTVCGDEGCIILYNFDGGVSYDFDGVYDNCYNTDDESMYPIVKKFFLGGHSHCIFESYTVRFHIKKVIKNV